MLCVCVCVHCTRIDPIIHSLFFDCYLHHTRQTVETPPPVSFRTRDKHRATL